MPINYTLDRMSVFRRWLFEKGTRAIECLNAFLLVSFSAVSAINYHDLLQLPSYFRFNITERWYWVLVALVGIIQVIATLCKSNRSNQASGLILILSSCLWLIISAIFSVNSMEVFTTAVTTYFAIAIFTGFAGYELLNINTKLEESLNGEDE